ncbi:Hsp70 family protein [Niveispirillum cyanobacteriorum]|uniref:Heat-shock protein n=1 Tax=Niveispirillum cyanobacteriorum TaxID=1612173 RepID=A0A2K9NED5_9PROT|nr:Hsp70 family protein [Niveispirillum cyanobacteriorum]AUN30896.1 heat-shock protein [Niveispirillum cyanobacteriorum]GGE80606.1 heat-shock protein [Niveispirillum cyanobacteriorum]
MVACGLDFGTSNSTLGVADEAGNRMLALEGDHETLPSAIFFDFETHRPAFGRAAINAYVAGGDGRLMRSIKSVLGTSLIDEETLLGRRRVGFREVIGLVIRHIKEEGERRCGQELTHVVHGRPVHFVDGDDAADQRAENALADIARASGFKDVSFQYEPIAAALAYEAQINAEQIALIADIGGGTSDFSIVRIGPDRAQRAERADDILANDGLRIGGTDFDRLLSLEAVMPHLGYRSPLLRQGLLTPNHLYVDLATWAKINFLYNPAVLSDVERLVKEAKHPQLIRRLVTVLEEHLGHALAMKVEEAKIALSGASTHDIDLSLVEKGLEAPSTRGRLGAAVADPVERLAAMTKDCLRQAGLRGDQVDAIFLTGGSTLLPAVRSAITGAVPEARIVEGDKFGAVGLGLTIEAGRRYG